MIESKSGFDAGNSRRLLRRAAWCGVVFGLAIVMTSLNLLPPTKIRYVVRSKIVLSESRLKHLKHHASEDAKSIKSGQLKPAQLLAVTKLDDGLNERMITANDAGRLMLVEVVSLWNGQPSDATHRNWLDSLSKVGESEWRESEASRGRRFASWHAGTAKHYVERHEFLDGAVASRPGHSEEMPHSIEFPASTQGVPTSFASHTGRRQTTAESGREIDFRLQLAEQLRRAERKLAEWEIAWHHQGDLSSGLIEMSSDTEISPHASGLPPSLAFSVLVLGIAAGLSAGWFEHRIHAGSSRDPANVARQLEIHGLEIVGQVELDEVALESSPWMVLAKRTTHNSTRQIGRRLGILSECVVGMWCLFLVGRFLLDPMWRLVLVDNPLAALARLLGGLP